MQDNKPIDFTEISGKKGNLGIITLQRPAALNALNIEMLHALNQKLLEYESNSAIKSVIIRAIPGRAFCAGGDIRAIYEGHKNNNLQGTDFFRDEYQVNKTIFHFKKPYIALLNGITLGGGVGISIYGSHRIATKNMSFAMPETAIGYFPDIGATYFLPRLPQYMGYYLGLTGERIGYQDCVALGLVDTIVSENKEDEIIHQLAESALHDNHSISRIIQSFAVEVPFSSLMAHANAIENCFSKNSIEEILKALKNENSSWCSSVIDLLNTRSPTSLKVTLRALQRGEKMNFDDCLKMEETLALHFMQSHDFFEGIRAVMIDKDRAPQWKPSKIEDVSERYVTGYFFSS